MEKKISIQRQKIQNGNPTIELINPCRIGFGIEQITDRQKKKAINKFEEESRSKVIAFFIPASGSGSRMFGALYDFINNSNPEEETIVFIENLLNRIEDFAFYNKLPQPTKDKIESGDIDVLSFLKLLLFEEGFNFGNMPKGLIPFHRYGNFIINPFQEHILQGTKIAGERSTFHFTINQTFEENIRHSIKILREITGIDFSFHFSFQNPKTNSIAFKENFAPLKDSKGNVVTRPAGHGTLIDNLNQINADLIFIRNIDNNQHQETSTKSIDTRKKLGGVLLNFQDQVFEILQSIEDGKDYSDFVEKINQDFKLNLDSSQLADIDFLKNYFNRPIRICGMVKNEGQPGGGPFWVKNADGTLSKQIIEKSQVSNTADQLGILIKSTHFNPVELVCAVRDYKGEKFNLEDFRNENLYFIVDKQHEGNAIKYIEQPGLWNGGMAEWTTLFYEIESECFSPVKTVLDLLKPLHQGN